MKKTLLSLFLVVMVASCALAQQNTITQTTLTAAVSGAASYSGNGNPNVDTQVSLNSTTNVTAALNATNGQFTSALYIDRELMGVVSLNTTTKIAQVVRGIEGTAVADHANNATVIVGLVGTLQSQGGPFQKYDPSGACTAASTLWSPWINIITGQEFFCGTYNTPGGSQIVIWQPITALGAQIYQNQPLDLVLNAAYTNATTTFSNVAGLAFPVLPSRSYHAVCRITWQGSAGTTGPKYQFTGPGSPTSVAVGMNSVVTATTVIAASAVAFSSAVANTGTVTTATNFTDTVDLGVVNGANAGTVQLQAAANGTGTLTIQPGSSCHVQ